MAGVDVAGDCTGAAKTGTPIRGDSLVGTVVDPDDDADPFRERDLGFAEDLSRFVFLPPLPVVDERLRLGFEEFKGPEGGGRCSTSPPSLGIPGLRTLVGSNVDFGGR